MSLFQCCITDEWIASVIYIFGTTFIVIWSNLAHFEENKTYRYIIFGYHKWSRSLAMWSHECLLPFAFSLSRLFWYCFCTKPTKIHRCVCKFSLLSTLTLISTFQLLQEAVVAEWLSSWLAEQEDRGSIPGLATWIFRDWLSPASKSRYGWKIAKSTLILQNNQPTTNQLLHAYFTNAGTKINSSLVVGGYHFCFRAREAFLLTRLCGD